MNDNQKIHILGISGSLKSTSTNTNILRIIAGLAPENVMIKLYNGLEDIPAFNPDKENDFSTVANLREELSNADGIIICTPEYAFGVPGVLKNALDWVVSSGELNEKPVAAISASPLFLGGDKAMASLLLTLTALGTVTNNNLFLSIGNVNNKLNKDSLVIDEKTNEELKKVLDNLIDTIQKNK